MIHFSFNRQLLETDVNICHKPFKCEFALTFIYPETSQCDPVLKYINFMICREARSLSEAATDRLVLQFV